MPAEYHLRAPAHFDQRLLEQFCSWQPCCPQVHSSSLRNGDAVLQVEGEYDAALWLTLQNHLDHFGLLLLRR